MIFAITLLNPNASNDEIVPSPFPANVPVVIPFIVTVVVSDVAVGSETTVDCRWISDQAQYPPHYLHPVN